MGYFVNKKRQEWKPSNLHETKNDNVMTTNEKIEAIEDVVLDQKPIKRIKKDKGLIEKVETTKVILTEDDKQLLMD